MTIRHLRGGVALIGTAADFASANPVLLERQLSIETDTGVQKVGDGTTHYADLGGIAGEVAGGGGVSHLRAIAKVQNSSGPYTGQVATCDLIQSANTDANTVGSTLILWTYEPGHTFQLNIQAPSFTEGTLTLYFAELDITNSDGSQRIALGRDAARDVTSGENFFVAFDDPSEAAGAGSDLVVSEDGTTVTTTAGGAFFVSFLAQFTATGLAA